MNFQMENTEDVTSLDSKLSTHTKVTGNRKSRRKLQKL